MKRIYVDVEPCRIPNALPWRVRVKRYGSARLYPTQASAVLVARGVCRDFWRDGMLAELRIKKRNGQYSAKGSTYGKDPRRSKG